MLVVIPCNVCSLSMEIGTKEQIKVIVIASNLSITGIPAALTSGSGTNRTFYASIYWANFTTSVINVLVGLPPSSTSMNLYRLTAAATSPGNLLANSLNATSGSVLGGQITYFV